MVKLSIHEVSKRKDALARKKKRKDISSLLDRDKLTLREAKEVIKNFESISDNQFYSFEQVLELFKECYTNNYTCRNDYDLKSLCDSICEVMMTLETASNPVHDMIFKQTRESRNFFKRVARNTKNYMKNAVDPLSGSIQDKDYKNHIKKADEFPETYKKVTLKDLPGPDAFNVSAGKVEECYNQIEETARKIRIYDRVLSNHEKLCKRFNMNAVVEDSKDFEYCVYELCELIDSYDLPFDIKYNVALENILYLFDINHKYQGQNPKEFIDEFFLARDVTPQNLIFMESVITENPFYYEEEKITTTSVNEFSYFLEASKENPVKKLLDDFKKENNKSPKTARTLIEKIYTKSPEQIVDGTPDFLAWLRTFIAISVFSVNPLLGLLTFFTDKLLAVHLKRENADKVVKYYKAEMKKTQNKIDKTNSKDKKEKLTKYYEKLESEYQKIKEYRDNLYTEKELDDEWEIDENCLAEGMFDKITIGYQLQEVKKIIRLEFNKVLQRLKNASNNKFKNYFDNGYFHFISDDEVEKFISSFDEELGRYIDSCGNVCMSFCRCDFDKFYEKFGEEAFKRIEELCAICKVGASDKVQIDYDGGGGSMYLIFTYMEPLYIEADLRDEIRECCFHPMTFNAIGIIDELSNLFDIMEEYPIEEFVQNLYEADLSYDDLNTIIEYFSNTSIFTLDQANNILMGIRENLSGINESSMRYSIDKFIKENVDIQDKEFDIISFEEDVDMYVAVNEALKDTIKKRKGDLENKAKLSVNKDKADSLRNNIKTKANDASVTAKLGAKAGVHKAKEIDSKQQLLSKRLDDAVSVLTRRIEDASKTKNREQIIKGSIIPSASKIIKMAIGFGAAWAINPAFGAIGALSMIFMGKNATKKERALILDEIDIELKVVERKIARAESEDDDDKVRELYKIQNKLKRERQRLKYRMKVYYDDKPIKYNDK